MSNVTNIMLNVSPMDFSDRLIHTDPNSLNLRADRLRPDAALDGYYYLMEISFGGATSFWGGSKVPECTVWAGAFNYLPLEEYKKLVAQTPWTDPYSVQLMVQEQSDSLFRVYGWRELAAYQ